MPSTADVSLVKRLIMYASNYQLVPSLQQLLTNASVPMEEYREDGTPVTIAAYGVVDNSQITLRIMVCACGLALGEGEGCMDVHAGRRVARVRHGLLWH